jgi:hypothetical protein
MADTAAKQEEAERAKEPQEYQALEALGKQLGLKAVQKVSDSENAAVYFLVESYSIEVALSTAIGVAGAVVTKVGEITYPGVAIDDEEAAQKIADMIAPYFIGKEPVAVKAKEVEAKKPASAGVPAVPNSEKKVAPVS